MLPKIIVTNTQEREALLVSLGLLASKVMEYEGSDGKIDDLRRFINFGAGVATGPQGINVVVWDADRLSPECQAVLLKPLEETSENMGLFLIASNENGLLPTILSRCLVTNNLINESGDFVYWKEVLECFSKGPAKCLSWADTLEKNEMEQAVGELIGKLKLGLDSEVNKNRLKILKLAIGCLSVLRSTNVNAKLAFGNFLISSWRLVRS